MILPSLERETIQVQQMMPARQMPMQMQMPMMQPMQTMWGQPQPFDMLGGYNNMGLGGNMMNYYML
jgi:hypothetical protein